MQLARHLENNQSTGGKRAQMVGTMWLNRADLADIVCRHLIHMPVRLVFWICQSMRLQAIDRNVRVEILYKPAIDEDTAIRMDAEKRRA